MAKEKPQAKEKKQTSEKIERSSVTEIKITPRLYIIYRESVVSTLMKRFAFKSIMQVPRLEKISINVGIGKAMQQDAKILDVVTNELELIVGQKVVVTKAKKSISNFKLREGVPVGVRVTLRGIKMYEFLDRLISIAMPRLRDFRGVSDKSFDGRGNYTFAIKEQIVFPEIDTDKVTKLWGMDITFVTTSKTDEECFELLKAFGLPFVKREAIVTDKK